MRQSMPSFLNENGQPLRVLIVDDNATNRIVLETLLAIVSAQTTTAEDGAQAVAAFEAGEFDLILMDLAMPVMDGLSATRRIRELEAAAGRPRTPILMVTANTLSQDVAASHEAGADRHLGKPIQAEMLFGAIAEAGAVH